ncbi:MAG: His/Gly/Thr/Pro-type tRNA ligase C-terminal domain-containing protein, partial [Burkholderiaceae bacterium]
GRMHAASAEGQGSMKSQFKRADASGAAWAMVVGDDELARGVVAMKALRIGQDTAQQHDIPLPELATWWQAQQTR